MVKNVTMTDSAKHPLATWMENHDPPLSGVDAAKRLICSEAYLSLVINCKRSVSLRRAVAWSKITGLPTEAFLMTEAAE